jgi:Zn-finger nucleic acid-binding protein
MTLASVPKKPVNCPVCKLPVYPAEVESHPLLHCAECLGLAMGREAAMKLQPFGPKTVQLSAEERDYKRPPFFEPRARPPFLICPFCGKRMEAVKFGNLKADICESCQGMWLEKHATADLNAVLGPYKRKMMNDKKGSGSSRLQRAKDSY